MLLRLGRGFVSRLAGLRSKSPDAGSIVPVLAKNARAGHPYLRSRQGHEPWATCPSHSEKNIRDVERGFRRRRYFWLGIPRSGEKNGVRPVCPRFVPDLSAKKREDEASGA